MMTTVGWIQDIVVISFIACAEMKVNKTFKIARLRNINQIGV
jgi:hypothetical protein